MDDRAAPLAQSQAMAKRLQAMNVPVAESYEPNEDHVFDHKYTVSNPRRKHHVNNYAN
jgi:hypothetical protein